jgi:hypothetical protein
MPSEIGRLEGGFVIFKPIAVGERIGFNNTDIPGRLNAQPALLSMMDVILASAATTSPT